MFILKKIITAVLLPPGCIIIILMGAGLRFIFRNRPASGAGALLLGLLLWGMSVPPTANYLMEKLERGIKIPAQLQGDVIILLGGGVNETSQDLTGTGAPSDDMMTRLVTAVRAQRLTGAPIMVSGGATGKNAIPEARIVRRFLHDLGVPTRSIIIEEKSRDTVENARYSAELCARNGFRRPLLVTSAFHMKRSLLIFDRHRLPVTPLPSGFRHSDGSRLSPYQFLPSAGALAGTVVALHEYLGIFFYRLTLPDAVTGK